MLTPVTFFILFFFFIAITDMLKQQLVSIAKSLDDDKWLYEATQEIKES